MSICVNIYQSYQYTEFRSTGIKFVASMIHLLSFSWRSWLSSTKWRYPRILFFISRPLWTEGVFKTSIILSCIDFRICILILTEGNIVVLEFTVIDFPVALLSLWNNGLLVYQLNSQRNGKITTRQIWFSGIEYHQYKFYFCQSQQNLIYFAKLLCHFCS